MEGSGVEEREQYVSDGGMAPVKLVVASPILAAAAAGTGFLLALCYQWNFYLIILMPALGGALAAGATYLWVTIGHCRNRWIAASMGAATGFLAFVLHFYFCLCLEVKFQMLPPMNMLAPYIEFRLRNDVQEDVARPNFGNKRDPSVVMNSLLLGMETLFITLIPVAAGWSRSQRAYSIDSQKWYAQEAMHFPPYTGPAIAEALEFGTLPQVLRQYSATTQAQGSCEVTVEYLRNDRGGISDEPIYLTVKDQHTVKRWFRPGAVRSTILNHVSLANAEAIALSTVFPKLLEACKKSEGELASETAEGAPHRAADQSIARDVTAVATVTPVPEPYRQRVRTKAYPWMVNLHDLIPVVFMFGGIGVAIWGGFMLEKKRLPEGISMIVTGVASAAWGVYAAKLCFCVYGNRWVQKRLRTEQKRRPDLLVDLDESKSTYVSIIPRDSFVKVKLVFSSDVGLLQVDQQKRRILIDCDLDQYTIPAGAIESCEPQCFFAPLDQAKSTELWVARLMVHFSDGTKEILLSAPQTSFRPVTNNTRRTLAAAFCDQITSIMDQKKVSTGRTSTSVVFRHIADR